MTSHMGGALLIILMAATILGFFSFMDVLERDWTGGIKDKVSMTVGVTAFLSAVTIVFERNGILTGLLLLLLGWLICDVVKRLNGSATVSKYAPWISFFLLLTYIGASYD
jgi:hypothetical protein